VARFRLKTILYTTARARAIKQSRCRGKTSSDWGVRMRCTLHSSRNGGLRSLQNLRSKYELFGTSWRQPLQFWNIVVLHSIAPGDMWGNPQVDPSCRCRWIYCTEQNELRLTVEELPSLVLAMLVAARYESSSSSVPNTNTLNGDCGTGSPDHVTSTVYCPASITL